MLGFEAELWFLPETSRPAGTLPQWVDLNKNLLVHFCNASNVRLRVQRDILDATTRCENGVINVSSYGDMEIQVTFDFPWEKNLTIAKDFVQSIVLGKTIACAVLDSDLFTEGGPLETDFFGVWSDWVLNPLGHSQPIDGAQRMNAQMVPAWSGAVTIQTDLPAAVTRFYPEFILPSWT